MATARVHSYLEALMLCHDELPLAEGQKLFHEGEPGHQMYIVRTGTLELRLGQRILEVVGPGGVVGEMALIDPAPRSATAVAGPDCSVVAIDEIIFHTLVKAVPSLALEVMGVMARRLRKGNAVQAADTGVHAPGKPARRTAPRAAARRRTA